MKTVYSARNSFEAHLVAGALMSAGIEAEVHGDDLQPLRGELPFDVNTACSVVILNDAQEEEARAVIARIETTAQRQSADLKAATSGVPQGFWLGFVIGIITAVALAALFLVSKPS